MQNGGELTWSVPDGSGRNIKVTLIIAPNSIRLPKDSIQEEITLTMLDRERAPMQIPNGGFGPMWTIQPRDTEFDPPARIRLEGARMSLIGTANPSIGQRFDLFGASLEEGWHRYGDVQVVDGHDDAIVLESKEGILRRGAWGHVFANTFSDSGVLVTCVRNGTPVPCAIFDDNGGAVQTGRIAVTQADYNNTHYRWYFTDIEPVCEDCTNNDAPYSQLALGINLCASWVSGTCSSFLANGTQVTLKAMGLCPTELADNNPTTRIDKIKLRLPPQYSPETAPTTWDPLVASAYGVSNSPNFTAFDRNFGYQAVIEVPAAQNCPP
jgi:hypothetical protein